MICQDCQFWDTHLQIWNDHLYGVCAKILGALESDETQALAYVTDCNEGPIHNFHTRWDFGGNLFEHK